MVAVTEKPVPEVPIPKGFTEIQGPDGPSYFFDRRGTPYLIVGSELTRPYEVPGDAVSRFEAGRPIYMQERGSAPSVVLKYDPLSGALVEVGEEDLPDIGYFTNRMKRSRSRRARVQPDMIQDMSFDNEPEDMSAIFGDGTEYIALTKREERMIFGNGTENRFAPTEIERGVSGFDDELCLDFSDYLKEKATV